MVKFWEQMYLYACSQTVTDHLPKDQVYRT